MEPDVACRIKTRDLPAAADIHVREVSITNDAEQEGEL